MDFPDEQQRLFFNKNCIHVGGRLSPLPRAMIMTDGEPWEGRESLVLLTCKTDDIQNMWVSQARYSAWMANSLPCLYATYAVGRRIRKPAPLARSNYWRGLFSISYARCGRLIFKRKIDESLYSHQNSFLKPDSFISNTSVSMILSHQ